MNPTALLFAEPSSVAITLVEALHLKNFHLTIVSDQLDRWRLSLHSYPPETFSLLSSPPGNLSLFPYLFVISLRKNSSALKQALPILENSNSKAVIALSFLNKAQPPLSISEKLSQLFKDPNRVVKIIYLGEPLGQIRSFGNGPLHRLLSQAISLSAVKLPPADSPCYFVSLSFASSTLLKEMFSYGISAQILCATSISLSDFLQHLKVFRPNLIANHRKQSQNYYLSLTNLYELSEPFSSQILNDTLRVSPPAPLPQRLDPKLQQPPRIRSLKVKRPHLPHPPHAFRPLYFLIALFWIIAFPFCLLFFSSLMLASSYHLAKAGHFSSSVLCLKTTHTTSVAGRSSFSLLSSLPLIGNLFSYPSHTFLLLEKGSSLGQRTLHLYSSLNQLSSHLIQGQDYDLTQLSQKIQFDLDLLYKESSFFESDYKNSGGFIANFIPQSSQISQFRHLLFSLHELSQDLPALLGFDHPVTYLVLLQNNLELRPTGGFIGSFALITFQNGKLIDKEFYDVYTADGQLKGYVEPPLPIANYLGEESWYLRDSNWDPDFLNSAQRARWFLDKSLNRQVDGVIALDLNLVANLLEITGPVDLVDFNDIVSRDNLNQKIQTQIESSFFPGSRKKADYLTALFNALFYRLQQTTPGQRLALARSFYQALLSRDLQISLPLVQSSRALSVLGWDGSLSPPSCQNNCLPIWTGLVEANLGVNKANYFITREAELVIKLTPAGLDSTLNLLLSNHAPSSSNEPETRYKVYLRALALPNTHFSDVSLYQKQSELSLTPELTVFPDHLEAGVLVDIPPQTKSLISFHWHQPIILDFSQPGHIVFQWRKQAGVPSHPVSVKFSFVNDLSLEPQPPFNLTEAGIVGYNAFLEKDLNATLSW